MLPETSDRVHDNFDNPSKAACRERNLLAVVEQAPELWDDDDEQPHLRGDWCELMGQSGIRTLEMLEGADVLAPGGGFVGVDLDAERIAALEARFPSRKWVAGDLLDALKRPEVENVAVLNFDSYEAVGTEGLVPIARQLSTILKRAITRFGACVLFMNGDLDAVLRLGRRPGAGLRRHAITLADVLEGALARGRRLTDDMLLPVGAESSLDGGFVGIVGCFEVYRGKVGGHRMANARILLR